jgi:hypothetical protein
MLQENIMELKTTVLNPVILQVPDVGFDPITGKPKDCISSKKLAKQLRLYNAKILELITMLDYREPDEKFELTLEFDYHRTGVTGILNGDKPADPPRDNSFKLVCYCNGGE